MSTLLALTLAATPASSVPGAHAQLWALFDDAWNWAAQDDPETATENGDDRFDDKLSDWSLAAIQARHAHEKATLAKAEAFDRAHRAELSEDDQLNLDLFIYPLRVEVDGFAFPQELLFLNQLESPPNRLAEVARATPHARVADLERYLKRLAAVPAQIDQQIALLQRGLALGVTPPKALIKDLPQLLESHLPKDPAQSPLYAPVFGDLPSSVPEADQARLRARAKELLSTVVFPAYRKLRDFAATTYVPKSRETLAASALPNGAAWYALDIRRETTLRKTPEEIHALGLAEVARIEKEMDALRTRTGFKGDRAAFYKFLRTDKRFYYATPEALLIGYRDLAKRLDPELPLHFKTLPRLTYGVQAMPDYEARTAPAAYYEPGSPDVGRAGNFMANLYDLKSRPKWAMADLTLHEAVPGHHLQFARAQELPDVPRFRRYAGYTAYHEGWALYCESLGDELGVLKDPYDKFGQLSGEIWRAVRLVVDTGLHAKGWTREQAVEFFLQHTGQPEHNARVEVDRYIVWPGQALAYKMGALLIRKLRTEAEQTLGAAFDEREFHDQVLGAGEVPLELLEERVHAWVKSVAAAQPGATPATQ